MLGFYPFIILIQAFCLYHAYSQKSEQKWFWIIIFFPFVGSVFYLYHNFYSRRNIENLKEGLKESLSKDYSIDKLEKKVKFANTHSNKLELAREYLKKGNTSNALEILQSCNNPLYESDPALIMLLMKAYYQNNDHQEVVKQGN
ncbi:MAG: hypothetical protein KDC16_12395 [Saprospiraceae bacterium]|nr:hypothetical protein [Saprospiraceae bacterium]MCB9327165.1 hypothetical protein [Lewinellaceae bacterium]